MKDRLLQFLKSENKSSAQLAEEIGVQPSGISHIMSGRNKPSLDFIIKMLEKYKFLSTEWLLFGKGTMYNEPEMQNIFDESIDLTVKKQVKSSNNEPVKDKEKLEGINLSVQDKIKPDVDRIVWFYNDNSFKEYFPDHE
jgi:transcriptional regulator with XRE-family HTH domain